MGKIANDKYYTEDSIAKYCVEKLLKFLEQIGIELLNHRQGLGHIWLICQITR